MADMFPPKEKMCHRCGFEKSCFDLVSSKKCGRWASLTLEHENGMPTTEYMCQDDLELGISLRNQKLLNQIIGSIDQLRKEEKNRGEIALATNAQVLGSMMDAAQRLAVVTGAISEVHAIEQEEEQLALTFRNNQ